MDFPLEVTKFTTTNATASKTSSPVCSESPVTNFINNLSPIKTIRPVHAAQVYLSLNSPPLVFKSPHTSSHREASFPQRPQCPSLLRVETTQYDYGSKKYDVGLDDSTKTTNCLPKGLINQKDMDTRNSLPTLSGGVDEYLFDPVEVDNQNSAYSDISKLEQSDGLHASTESKNELMSDGNDACREVDAPPPFKEQAGDDFPGNFKFGVEPVHIVEGQKFVELPSIEYPDDESGLSMENVSKKQQIEISGVQNVGGSNQDKCDRPQLLPEQKQIVPTIEKHGGSGRASTGGPVESAMQHDYEASQNQRGISRRCLQFGEAQPESTFRSASSSNPQNNIISTRKPLSIIELEGSEASNEYSNTTSSKRPLVSLSQPMPTMVPPRHCGNFPSTISQPSGIGLHLNSIVNNVPVGCSATVRMKLADNNMSGLGMRSVPGTSCFLPENVKSSSGSSSLVAKVSEINEDTMFQSEASIAAGSTHSEALHPMGPLNTLPPVEHYATPLSKMKVNVEHAHSFEEIKQPSPIKKRKKSSSTLDGDGCKRCNCKKTKCLKLYCDCFAAGIYCAEPCSCQGCFNRPEYEETVLETRQQIESRNPLAFAPKIVQRVTEFPSNNAEEGNGSTPSSARHKKGCNCKKSMCQKKYCECYQANVGCSSGCRCEGCKNVYGRKEYGLSEEMMSNRGTEERLADTFDDRLEMVATEQDFLLAEFYDSNHHTPLTPLFRGSDQGKDAPKLQLTSGGFIPSPESDLTILSSYAKPMRSLGNSDSNDVFLQRSKGVRDGNSYGQETDYHNSEMVDQFSPRCDSLDMSNLTPLPNPSMDMSSASSKTMGWTNAPRLQPCTGSSRYPSGGSLRWRCSPISPMTQVCGTKDHERVDDDSRYYDIFEDDTPKMLKDASTPNQSVKVSSPNQKRVSPPHTRTQALGSSSSGGGLKSGRKFILQAVPCFPSLTPCIVSKGSTNQKESDV